MAYPTEPIVNKGELPDLFAPPNMDRITLPDQWPQARQAWRDLVITCEYGGMPPQPDKVEFDPLNFGEAGRLTGRPKWRSYKIRCYGGAEPISITVQVLISKSDQPVPVIIEGDRCWFFITEDIIQSVMDAGCALMLFNRTDLAEDRATLEVEDKERCVSGLTRVYPDQSFGALSAWAWGYHRCVDLIETIPELDSSKIAITGHSRGGKTTLVAGATDERIALVNDNGSCAGGSSVYRYVGHGGETINILNVFPYWFCPEMRQYLDNEDKIPFDQHCLLASIAPRLLLSTSAADDRWSNPEGMVLCAQAANEVYAFLGAAENHAFHIRPGEHKHSLADWNVLLDFIGRHWQEKESKAAYNKHQYNHLKPIYSWKRPD
jgi:hypothetical protein